MKSLAYLFKISILGTFIVFFNACSIGGHSDFGDEEYAVINFEGPISYSYQLKDGTVKTYTVEKEEKLELENVKEIAGFSQMATFIRLNDKNDYEMKIFFGPDSVLKHPTGSPIFPEEAGPAYQKEALVYNHGKSEANWGTRPKPEGPIDALHPITISGKMIGIDMVRKRYRCKDILGEEHEFGVIGGNCVPETVEYLGLKTFSYSRETIASDLLSNKNTGLISATESLEIVLRNGTDTVAKPQWQAVPAAESMKAGPMFRVK